MAYSYTPTEYRIIGLLSDGMPHSQKEMVKCLYDDDQGTVRNLIPHLHGLRKKLREIGQEIVCELVGNGTYYRHVRLLVSPFTPLGQ